MFHKIRYIILVCGLIAVSACSSAHDGDDAGHNGPAKNRPKSHVLSEQLNALEKSKELQRSLNKTAEDRLKAIDKATR